MDSPAAALARCAPGSCPAWDRGPRTTVMPERKAIHNGIRNCSQSRAGPRTARSRGTTDGSQSHVGPPTARSPTRDHRQLAVPRGTTDGSQSHAGPPTARSPTRDHRRLAVPRRTTDGAQSHAGPPRSCACGMAAPFAVARAIAAWRAGPVRRGTEPAGLVMMRTPRSRRSTCVGTAGGTADAAKSRPPRSIHSSDAWRGLACPIWDQLAAWCAAIGLSSPENIQSAGGIGASTGLWAGGQVDHVDRCRLSTGRPHDLPRSKLPHAEWPGQPSCTAGAPHCRS